MIRDFLKRRAQKRREQRSEVADALVQRLDREHSLVVDDAFVAGMGVGRRLLFKVIYGLVIRERMHMMADDDGQVVLMTNAEFHRFMLRRSGMRETEIRRRDILPVFADTMAEQAIAAIEEETVWVDSVAAELAEPQPALSLLEELDSTLVSATLGGSPLSGIMRDEPDEVFATLPALAGAPSGERAQRKPTRRLQLTGPAASAGESGGDLGWFNLDVASTLLSRENLPDARQSLPDRRREPWAANEESEVNFEQE